MAFLHPSQGPANRYHFARKQARQEYENGSHAGSGPRSDLMLYPAGGATQEIATSLVLS
jgi:hypothetical protein